MARRERKQRSYRGKVETPKTAEDRIREARYLAREVFPYFSAALSSMKIRIKDTVLTGNTPTMAVDKHMRVYCHPEFIENAIKDARAISSENPCKICGATKHGDLSIIAGVLLHEMWHPLREHHERWKNITDYQHNIGNAAADCEINDDLIETFKWVAANEQADICLPDWIIYPSRYDMPDDLLMEEYYHRLYKDAKVVNVYNNCGSGAGGEPMPWEDPEPMPGDQRDETEGLTEGEVDLIRKEVAEKINQEAKKGRGNIPAGFTRWSGGIIPPSTYDWKREFSKILSFTMAGLSYGYDLTTYSRLSRTSSTLDYAVILPTYATPEKSVAMVIDTSGSMGEKAIQDAISNAEKICKGQNAQLNLVTCDAHAESKLISSMREATLKGGGGTDMRVGVAKAMEMRPSPDVVVLFTDGFTPWPEPSDMGKSKLIVCLVGDYVCGEEDVPSYAKVVRIDTGSDSC